MKEGLRCFHFLGLEFPIPTLLEFKLSIIIWIVLLLILSVAQVFFQYEMTSSDIPGGLISGFLLAYLIPLILK